jgi:hypothetical protein
LPNRRLRPHFLDSAGYELIDLGIETQRPAKARPHVGILLGEVVHEVGTIPQLRRSPLHVVGDDRYRLRPVGHEPPDRGTQREGVHQPGGVDVGRLDRAIRQTSTYALRQLPKPPPGHHVPIARAQQDHTASHRVSCLSGQVAIPVTS